MWNGMNIWTSRRNTCFDCYEGVCIIGKNNLTSVNLRGKNAINIHVEIHALRAVSEKPWKNLGINNIMIGLPPIIKHTCGYAVPLGTVIGRIISPSYV